MNNKEERVRLNIDFDEVFPGETLEIAGQKVPIRPLGLKKLSSVMKQLREVGSQLSEAGITWENYDDTSSLVILTSTILENCPNIISEASNIHLDDIERLPLDVQVSIVEKVLFVNTKSKDSLEKNLESLGETLADLMGTGLTPLKSETSSKS